jgi:HD-GYP domain-containing protein (c-di-GMP phosphodiesterase class II)
MSKADFHRLTLGDLQLGEPIPWDIYDGKEQLLVRQGFIPQSEKQLETLLDRGLYANAVEYEKTHGGKTVSAQTEKKPQNQVFSTICQARDITQSITLGILAQAPLPDTPAAVAKAVGLLDEAIQANPDIALASIPFKQSADGYTSHHLVDAAILSMMVAKSMGKTSEEIAVIASAALTMNLGMLRLQDDLQNLAEPPSEEEKAFIENHPAASVQLLKEAGVTDEIWLSYVLNHHEHMDGSGYPSGKSGGDIPEGSKIIALADRYTTLIAPRHYRKAMHPSQALKTMLIDGGKTCDAKIAAYFIKELGLYPPGAAVKLVNGETGIVMRKGFTAMAPVVRVIKNQSNITIPAPQKRDTGVERYAIKEALLLEPEAVPFSMQQFWGAEAT